mmetsp:Transcript_20082/g.47828  ORF Transcript_20082/g.47828 Transcript_20082/m.47828 type:complete len:212 (-) Transcript_20082:328-963(-)
MPPGLTDVARYPELVLLVVAAARRAGVAVAVVVLAVAVVHLRVARVVAPGRLWVALRCRAWPHLRPLRLGGALGGALGHRRGRRWLLDLLWLGLRVGPRAPADDLVQRGVAVDHVEQLRPLSRVQARPVEKRHRKKPSVAVHCNELKPVVFLHAIPCKVDSQSRLRNLGRDFLCREVDFPGSVGISVQTKVFSFRITLRIEPVDVDCQRFQ